MPKAKAPKKFKLDLFGIIKRIDSYDYFLYETLSDEEKKELSPFMLFWWFASTKDDNQLIRMNHLLNHLIFNLPDRHKELLVKLFVVASNKQDERYSFDKNRNKAATKASMSVAVIRDYYKYSEREAKDVQRLLSPGQILEMAESLGYEKEQITKLKKELK